ncbi:hypothetical protein OKA05_24820 [Luteolibacter arcticus]|uniref:Secreted protein n=1 Tax=Luteolibacter arcticus TaxID=1581411 RepID=A0ABT3GQP8_9BACT|nr:hypothetical protein [Luteolibacter arcticus]MCW1925805.1 hypothetical protein [Luteolibacter arcticus]
MPIALGAILLVAVTVSVMNHQPDSSHESPATVRSKTSRDPQTPSTPAEVVLRPLPVSRSSATHEWTEGDATLPTVIEKIAHNPDEFVRLVEENDRIKKRQLVYRTKPAWDLVEQARATGEPVRQLTLPGLDGQEVQVEVTSENVDPSGLSGTFGGHVAGHRKSLVTLAFIHGREAFTVVSPDDGVFLQGHPREKGEILVASFDPEKYLTVPGAESIKTLPVIPSPSK